jgi:polyhydroxybutyrate depolymerase
MFDRVARSFQLYVPRSYTGARPVPLVFDFHGFGSNAVQQMIYGNFMPLADRDGFLIVAPDGQGSGEARHFNLTGESGAQDDVAMVRALVAYLESRLCIDSFRIYATGMSDGGAMSSVLGCTASDIFAAVAPVAVVVSGANCRGGRPMPIMAFSGTADPIVPYKGGEVKCCGHPHLPSAPSAVAGWVSHDGCHKPHESRVASDVVRRAWTRCLDSSAVVFYVVQGGGHTWPGSIAVPGLGRTTHTIDASALIWQFFSAHTLVG